MSHSQAALILTSRRFGKEHLIVLIDNYDSFVFNLARYFERLGQVTHVVRNDCIDVAGLRAMGARALVLSPGPGTPEGAGRSLEIVAQMRDEVPILGVCLGHQTIAAAWGARVVRGPEPVHGRASRITHDEVGVFEGLSNPLTVCRYHSLVVEEAMLPNELVVSARTEDGIVMAMRHRELPVVGVQFHPESILTEGGYELLAGFLRLAGLCVPRDPPRFADERREAPRPAPPMPQQPVTF